MSVKMMRASLVVLVGVAPDVVVALGRARGAGAPPGTRGAGRRCGSPPGRR